MCAHPKRRKSRPLPCIFFPLRNLPNHRHRQTLNSATFTTRTTSSHSTPLPPHLAETNLPNPLSHTQQISRPLIVSSRDNETPHPQLFDLRPQSLQTRTGGFPSTPPRRGIGTRGDGIEPGVSDQCSASSRVEGRQEFG